MIAHRISTLRECDSIYEILDGALKDEERADQERAVTP
jgi:ABC-type multidrug transport system fused ATPase/permease subunit